MTKKKKNFKSEYYQPELDDIIQTLKRIELKLLQTQPYLKDFRKLLKRFKSASFIPLSRYSDNTHNMTRPIGQPDIRRELQQNYTIHIYLDIDQYIRCRDEILAEYIELYLRTWGNKLRGMQPMEILNKIEIPVEHEMRIKIIGERILLQLRERDLLAARQELLNRLDEIVWDLYHLHPRDKT